VQLGPNSGAADAASGAAKAGCRNGQNQQLLGVANWLWQPDLSAGSHASCYSREAGDLGFVGHGLLLPQQPCAAVAVAQRAQTSQRQQKQQPGRPCVPSCLP